MCSERLPLLINVLGKLFAVLSIGMLIDNETISPRLSWTSKIASIVPGWGLMDPIGAKQATIIDLMSHRTGLPRHEASYRWSDDIPAVVSMVLSLSVERRGAYI